MFFRLVKQDDHDLLADAPAPSSVFPKDYALPTLSNLVAAMAAAIVLTAALISSGAQAQLAPANPPQAGPNEPRKSDVGADNKTKEEKKEARKERREHRKAVNHRQRRKH